MAITAAQTHPLRRDVLRSGTPSDLVVFEGDDEPTTSHWGAAIDGSIVAIATWVERSRADRPGLRGLQLRGMATDPNMRGRGLGAMLLADGVDRARAKGYELVWAHARVTALDFYEAHGFRPIGDTYVDATTSLEHRDIIAVLP